MLEMSNVQHRWSMKHRHTWHANYFSYRIFKIVLKPNLASCVGALLILFHFAGMYAALFAIREKIAWKGKRRYGFFWFRRNNNARLHVFAVCVSRTRVSDYFSGCGRSASPSPSLLFLFLFPPHKGVMINQAFQENATSETLLALSGTVYTVSNLPCTSLTPNLFLSLPLPRLFRLSDRRYIPAAVLIIIVAKRIGGRDTIGGSSSILDALLFAAWKWRTFEIYGGDYPLRELDDREHMLGYSFPVKSF